MIECTCKVCKNHDPLSNKPKGHWHCKVCKEDLTNLKNDVKLYTHADCWIEKYAKQIEIQEGNEKRTLIL